jgi:gamma-glutamyl:cysteine ligase YbdK (ATP-grasp superfamily)
VVIAALARALTAAAAEGSVAEPAGAYSESAGDALLAQNEWQAARYGLDGVRVDPELEGGCEPLRDATLRLRDLVGPTAESLGDGGALAGLDALLERGAAAARIRQEWRARGSLPGVVEWLVEETNLGTGLDRRRSQREPG